MHRSQVGNNFDGWNNTTFMSRTILAIGASNSSQSINKQLAVYAANQLTDADVQVLDLNDYQLPLYAVDLERESGIPENALRFQQRIEESTAIVLSVAEYNGLHTSAFKNLWDWLSRIPREVPMNIWNQKPMLLMSASPSRRQMNNVFKVSKELFPHFGANIVADFYLPSFNHFFANGQITEENYRKTFLDKIRTFEAYLNQHA